MVVSKKKVDSLVMRIGIDARFYQEAGIGRYIRNLLHELQELDKENEYYIFLLKREYDTLVYHTSNFHKVLADFKWYGFAEQRKFPALLNKYNLDLVHFPHFNIPIFYRGKFIVTIHDLIHQKYSMKRATKLNPLMYRIKSFAYSKTFKFAIRKSQKIITVSDYVKKDLVKTYKVNSEKIVVTPEAVEYEIISLAKSLSQEKIKGVLEKFGVNSPYIYYVGNSHPHKNIEGLIKAFIKLRSMNTRLRGNDGRELQLVLSGKKNYFWERIMEEFPFKDIIYTGFVSDEEMVSLMKSATVYVQPSFEEGFGIPPLEAMACNCPVVSSNSSSLPDICGDAAVYFNPKNIDEMAEKISEVLNSQKLQKQLIEKGQKRYKEFSWKKMSEETLKIYREAI